MNPKLETLMKQAASNTRKRKSFFKALLKYDVHFFRNRMSQAFEVCGFDVGGEFYVPIYLTRAEMNGNLDHETEPVQMNAFVFFKRRAQGCNVIVGPTTGHAVRLPWEKVLTYLKN